MSGKRTAGAKLRSRMNAVLRARGAGWEWDEHEREALDAACDSATRAERLRQVFEAELAGDSPRSTVLTRVSAEIRHHERAVVDLVGLLTLGVEPVKSPRHVRAARARWARRDRANQPVLDGRVVSMPMGR